MRIKEGFILREVADSYVVVAVGAASVNFKGVIKINESAAILWRAMESEDKSVEDLVGILINEYTIDEKTARQDVIEFTDGLKGAGIIE